jgi:Ca2+-binding EF-hand superfamily protein
MSNFKTIIFLVLILAISSKNFKKQEGSQPAFSQEHERIFEIGFKNFVLNAGLDIESFIRGAQDTCKEAQIPCPEREVFEQVFHHIDLNGNGFITGEEFKQVLEKILEEGQRNPQTNFAQLSKRSRWVQKSQLSKRSRWVQKSQSQRKWVQKSQSQRKW